MSLVPQEAGDAESLVERLTPRLQHANSGVVLTAIKVLIYLSCYVKDPEYVRSIYKKLSPPLGTFARAPKKLFLKPIRLCFSDTVEQRA
jgi:AP-2 complex subunit beta-1